MIFIFSAESAPGKESGGGEGRQQAKNRRYEEEGEGECGRGWLLCGSWQSVEGNGADQ